MASLHRLIVSFIVIIYLNKWFHAGLSLREDVSWEEILANADKHWIFYRENTISTSWQNPPLSFINFCESFKA